MNTFLQHQETKNTSRRKKLLRRTFSRVQKISLIVVLWSILVGAIYGLYNLVFEKGIFIVKNVEVEGSLSHLTAEQVREAADVRIGENLFSVNLNSVQKKMDDLRWIRESAVARKIPSTIWIYANEYVPAALLVQDEIYLIDANGKKFKVLSAGDDKDYPVITGAENDGEVRTAIGLLADYMGSPLKDFFTPAEVNIDHVRGNSIVLAGSGAVVRVGYNDAPAKLREFYSMIGAISTYNNRIRYVDLNIPGKVVVKYEN